MIAVVHGPIGCGKSTALREWLTRGGWSDLRGYRTFFDSASGTIRLASWYGRIECSIARREGGVNCHHAFAFNPAYGPSLHVFLDEAFSGGHAAFAVQPPVPVVSEPVSSPWQMDAGCFWSAVMECLAGENSRPIVIDELGVLETLQENMDAVALGKMVRAIRAASRAILVVQERAWTFWKGQIAAD